MGRYHPPAVRDAILQLAIARERLATTAKNAYNRFLGDFVPLYPVCKVCGGGSVFRYREIWLNVRALSLYYSQSQAICCHRVHLLCES